MKLFEYINKEQFDEMVAQNYIGITYHPTVEGLRIINYTKTCNSEKIWNDTTEKCRGLIVDKNDEIIARPFKKFYNYEEYDDPSFIDELASDFNIDIYEKLDGSLGILYWVDDVPYIATKGSFTSEQAIHATELLHTKYRHTWDSLFRNKTYLFEIIYPEDLHVVTYKDVDDIFLLAVISTNNFFEYPPEIHKGLFPIVKRYTGYGKHWKELRNIIDGSNREGFVVKIGNFRVKLKYEEYWRLHYLKAGLSEKMIRKCLVSGDTTPIDEALTMFDEEHIIYYRNIMDKYTVKFGEIIDKCLDEYRDDFDTKKEAAEYIKTCTYPHVLFAMYNKKNHIPVVWNYVMNSIK